MVKGKRFLSIKLVLLSFALTFLIPSVAGYEIDGDLTDWNLDLEGNDWSLESTWIPSYMGSKLFVVEDNSDPQYFNSSGDLLPGFKHYGAVFPGVHIMTTPAGSIIPIEESLIKLYGTENLVVPPSGGESYDIEALYLDRDSEFLYIALVTSVNPSKWYRIEKQAPKIGDLDLLGSEYGIRLSSTGGNGIGQFQLCKNPAWADAIDYPLEAPYGGSPSYMVSCYDPIINLGDLGLAKVEKMVKYDNGNPNWIFELAIPLGEIGDPGYIYLNQVRVSEGCGNDFTDVPDQGCPDADGDGFLDSACGGGDCDDSDPEINPEAPESCDGVDNNCNGLIDEGVLTTYYQDSDGDGYGNLFISTESCIIPEGYILDNSDCDDGNPNINPGALEICDGIDNNCDGQIDENLKETYYPDFDGDGYGDPEFPLESCIMPLNHVADNTDCNDNDYSVNPGATEILCDGIDNDCNPLTLDAPDADGDGYDVCSQRDIGDSDGFSSDCDDAEFYINPGAYEVCNDGIDNNCDGQIDEACSSSGPSKIWYFADGFTGENYYEYVVILNPNEVGANVNITYMFSNGSIIYSQIFVPANQRVTLDVKDAVGLDKAVSIILEGDEPIVAERPMYFKFNEKIVGGHNTHAATSTSLVWYFAEGYTGTGFQEYITIMNPVLRDANVDIIYMFSDGSTQVKNVFVRSMSRIRLDVNKDVGPGKAVSAKLVSNAGIVAERPMYFEDYGGYGISGGHISVGSMVLSDKWFFSEGFTGNDVSEFHQYLTIQNPNPSSAFVRVIYMFHDGTTEIQNIVIGPNTRYTIDVNSKVGTKKPVSTKLESNLPIMAERPMYFKYRHDVFPGGINDGHNTIGGISPSTTWYLADGHTDIDCDEYITIMNPNAIESNVQITYYTGYHSLNTLSTEEGYEVSQINTSIFIRNYTILPTQRYTIKVNREVGLGKEVSAKIVSDQPIFVERPMYYKNWNGLGIDWGTVVLGYAP